MFSKKNVAKWDDGCANLILVVISQCVCVSNNHIAHSKYIRFLFVNFSSVKGRKNRWVI